MNIYTIHIEECTKDNTDFRTHIIELFPTVDELKDYIMKYTIDKFEKLLTANFVNKYKNKLTMITKVNNVYKLKDSHKTWAGLEKIHNKFFIYETTYTNEYFVWHSYSKSFLINN